MSENLIFNQAAAKYIYRWDKITIIKIKRVKNKATIVWGGGSDDASNYEGEEELKQTHFLSFRKKRAITM